MMLKPHPPSRYGTVAMALHWLIAALVLLNIYIGLRFDDIPKGPKLAAAVQLHESVGLSVLCLSVLFVAWRLINPGPPMPDDMPRYLKWAARATHFLLYALILCLPLSGWIMASASRHGFALHYFGTLLWPYFPGVSGLAAPQKHEVQGLFGGTHQVLAWTMMALVAVHVGGALYHHFHRKDDVLKRMIPWTGKSP